MTNSKYDFMYLKCVSLKNINTIRIKLYKVDYKKNDP